MESKTYSTGKITEDTAPTVAVGNGVIDTAPVITKEQQKKITMLSRLKRLKTFPEFIVETLLLEMPSIENIDKDGFGKRLAELTQRVHKISGSTNNEIKYGNDIYKFHGNIENPHSISRFDGSHPDFYVHADTAKLHGGSAENIIRNIEDIASKNKPVQSHDINTAGSKNLWKRISEKHPNNTFVVDRQVSVSGPPNFTKIGLLKDMDDSAVWGDDFGHRRIRLELKE